MKRKSILLVVLLSCLCAGLRGQTTRFEVDGGIAYIQNQTFTESQTINADSVFVGSNVTISKPQGPVSVDNGTLRINYQDKVIIYDSFKVKSGAQLKIQR